MGTKYQAMLLEIKMIENKRAFVVDRRDSRMSRFLGGDFSMVDFIISERNRKVSEQACEGEMLDPMAHQTDVPRPSTKRQRLELVNGADTKWVPLLIEAQQINVLATWDTRNQLCMESTTENLEMLLMSPSESSVFPLMKHVNVHWYAPNSKIWSWW